MNTREKPDANNREAGIPQAEGSSFDKKTEEYLDRIKEGKETIEQILSGITPDGPIYNTIKEKFYAQVPSKLRQKTGSPLPYPALEEFLPQATLTVDEEENIQNKRVHTAILYFSQAEWAAEEERQSKEAERQERIADLKKGLGIEPASDKTEDAAPQPEVEISSEEKKIQLEKTVQLPEMERKHDQEAIGDLNGSHEGLVAHLENRDLASLEGDELIWKGGDKKVVFIGDILGDRTPEGLRVYGDLIKLKEQAQKVGGNVVWLSGNHENMFNAALCGFSTEFGESVAEDMQKRLNQYAGNLELAEFLPESEKKQIVAEFLGKRGEILETIKDSIMRKERTLKFMRSSPENYSLADINLWASTIEGLKSKQSFIENTDESVQINELLSIHELLPKSLQNLIGNKILEHTDSIKEKIRSEHPEIMESIKQQQLIQIQDDVLYTHTNLTKGMVELLFKNMNAGETLIDSANKLNAFYKYCLESYIDGKASELSPAQISNFNKTRDAFISTSGGSRVNFSEDPKLSDEEKESMKKKLKALGVNLVIHGHNDEEGSLKGSSDLPIISIDRSAYKSDNPKNFSPTSAGAISKNGSFSYF